MKKKILKYFIPFSAILLEKLANFKRLCFQISEEQEKQVLMLLFTGPRINIDILLFCKTLNNTKLKRTLNRLELNGFISKEDIGTKKRKYLYSITAKGISYLPVIDYEIQWYLTDKANGGGPPKPTTFI